MHPRIVLKAYFICFIAALFYSYEYLLRILPSAFSQDLINQFRISAWQFGDLSAFYYYAYTPMQIGVGLLLDRFGSRYILTLASLSCAIGTGLFANTASLSLAEAGRFLMGLGSAFAFIGALRLGAHWLPKRAFGVLAGLVATLGLLGAVGGNILLAQGAHVFGMDKLLHGLMWGGMALTAVLWLGLRDAPHVASVKHVALDTGRRHLWHDVKLLLHQKTFWWNGLIGALFYLPVSAFAELWGVPWLKVAGGYTTTEATSLMALLFLGWAIGGPFLGGLAHTMLNRRRVLCIGSLITAGLLMILMYRQSQHVFEWDGLLLFAIGLSASAQIVIITIASHCGDQRIQGTALALTNLMVMTGGALFQPLIGGLLDFLWSGALSETGVPIYSAYSYQEVLWVIPLCCVLAAFLTRKL